MFCESSFNSPRSIFLKISASSSSLRKVRVNAARNNGSSVLRDDCGLVLRIFLMIEFGSVLVCFNDDSS
jgi:hypothetical protein